MSSVEHYLSRMSPADVWPAGHDPAATASKIGDVLDPLAPVLRWASNNQAPMNDMLAAWVALGIITRDQADATSAARDLDTAEFVRKYRATQPLEPSAEERAELLAAFGPGETVVDVISGRRTRT